MELWRTSAVDQRPKNGVLPRIFREVETFNEITDLAMAERVGFEPTVRLPVRRISSAVLSTTQPPLRGNLGMLCRFGAAGRGAL